MRIGNCKVLTDERIKQFESRFEITYDSETTEALVHINNMDKTTRHSTDTKFHINGMKNIGSKIVFSMEAINIWKELQTTGTTYQKNYSLFLINNTVNKLKKLYQDITKENVLKLIDSNFEGIKRKGEF